MITFLFWNLKRNSFQEIVANLATQQEVDVIMLAECTIPPAVMLKSLNPPERPQYHYARCEGCGTIEIFTRFPARFIRPIREVDRLTIRHLQLPGLTEILLAISHFPSKVHWDRSSQAAQCFELAESIRRVEKQIGHSRTVLVGDVNMNPFEDGLVSASALHGVMTRDIAAKGTRIVQGKEFPFFYNPMWSLLGDASPGPAGTFYQWRSEQTVFFWNMFDQVLIRPDLLPRFANEHVEIVESDGETSFLSSHGNIPEDRVASDHLPILFKLSL